MRLVTVAWAWGGPLFALGTVADPSEASYPSLAAILKPVESQAFWLIPLFAVVGIVIVAWPFERGPQVSTPLALALLALGLTTAGLGLWGAKSSGSPMIVWTILIGLEAPLVGFFVTSMSLWRRRKWFAIAWIVGWPTTIFLLQLANSNTGEGSNLGAGFFIIIALLILSGASFWASVVAFIIIELKRIVKARNRSRRSLIVVASILLILVGFTSVSEWRGYQAPQQSKSIVQPKISAASRRIVPGKFAFLNNSNNIVIKAVGDSSTSTIYKLAKDEEVDALEFSPDGNKLLLIGHVLKNNKKDINVVYDLENKKLHTLPDSFSSWKGNNQLYDGIKDSSFYDLEKNRYIKIAPDIRDYVEWVSKESQDGERIIITDSERASRVLVGTKGNWREMKKSFRGPGVFIDAVWIGKNRIGVMDNEEGDIHEELMIFDKKTGKLVRRLATPGNPRKDPFVWMSVDSSPDGSQLLFEIYNDETEEGSTWLMNSKTGKKRKLPEDSLTVLNWLPDNRHFLALEGENDVWLADIEAKKAFKEKLLTYSGEFIDWTPY